MEKEFRVFCARIRRSREGIPPRTAYPLDVREEIVRWASRLPLASVARGIGVSCGIIRVWRRSLPAFESESLAPEAGLAAHAPVFNVTRISVETPATGESVQRPLARLVHKNTQIDFFDEAALARCVEGVLA